MSLPQHLQNYCALLRQLNIGHEVVEHPPVQHHYSEALEWLNITLADCLPTLVMKADDRFITLVSRADCRLDFKKVKEAALRLRALLADLGLVTFPMVTGGKGIHVIAPLDA